MHEHERLVNLHHVMDQDFAVARAEAQLRESHQQNIEYFRATPDEIEAWYFARDPIDVTTWLISETSSFREDSGFQLTQLLQSQITDSITTGRGGLALIAHELFPQSAAGQPESDAHEWFGRIEDAQYQPAVKHGHLEPGPMNTHGLLEICLQATTHPELAIPASRLPHVYLAAEMLRASTVELVQARNMNALAFTELEDQEAEDWIKQQHGGELEAPLIVMAGISEEAMSDFVQKQNVLSDRLLCLVAGYGTHEWGEEHAEYQSDQIKMLGLKALMHYASSWMSDSFERPNPKRQEAAKEVFGKMVATMLNVFGTTDKPINQRLRSPDVKGDLHEILWFMDAYVLRLTERERYGNVRVTPAYSRGDAPRIGYPEQRRGIDMYVMCGDVFDYVQLKSSPNKHNGRKTRTVTGDATERLPDAVKAGVQQDDDYHPIILKLHEPNFLETNPRRLIAKLNAYARWADGGFDVQEGKKLDKYVMASVKEEFSAISRRTSDRSTQLKRALSHFIIEPALTSSSPKRTNTESTSSSHAAKRKAARKSAKNARRKQRR